MIGKMPPALPPPSPEFARRLRAGTLLVVAVLAVVAAAKPILFDSLDPDCWLHLLIANRFRAEGLHPLIDTWSFASVRTPWTPFAWLAELGMSAVWQAGGFRLAVLCHAMTNAGFVTLVALACLERTRTEEARDAHESHPGRSPRSRPADSITNAASAAPTCEQPCVRRSGFRVPQLALLRNLCRPTHRSRSTATCGTHDLIGGTAAFHTRPTDAPANRVMPAVVATVAAAILSLAYLSFRPVTLALVLLATAAWLLVRDRRLGERTRLVWLLVPLTAVCVNVHLYAIFVPLWLAALTAGAVVEWALARRRAKSDWRRVTFERRDDAAPGVERWAVVVTGGPVHGRADLAGRLAEPGRRVRRCALLTLACSLACLATPLLPGVAATAVQWQTRDPIVAARAAVEYQVFYAGTMGKVSAAIVAAMFGCAVANRRKLRVGEWAWLIVGLVLLGRMGRFAPVFALGAAPIFAATLPTLRDNVLARRPILAAMAMLLVLLACRLTIAFPSRNVTLEAWLNRVDPTAGPYPCAAAAFVEAHVRPRTGRLIDDYTWGGYLEWRLHGRYQMLMDGRTNLFTDDFWHRTRLAPDDATRRQFLATVSADAALIPSRGAFSTPLRQLGWTIAYDDGVAQVLLPPAGAVADAGR